jgi:hypothetical protein
MSRIARTWSTRPAASLPGSGFKRQLATQPETGFWLYGPEVFRTYCDRNGLRADTASSISVDHARTLSKDLRKTRTMVLRLKTVKVFAVVSY